MAKRKPKQTPKPAKGCRQSARLQQKPAGAGLKSTKRTIKKVSSKGYKPLKPSPTKPKCEVWKKSKSKALSTYCLFVRHVYNYSHKNGYCLHGKELMLRASQCWKALTPEQRMNFENTTMSTKLKGPSKPKDDKKCDKKNQ